MVRATLPPSNDLAYDQATHHTHKPNNLRTGAQLAIVRWKLLKCRFDSKEAPTFC
ncbi:hypothetical protein HDF14_005355 [Edaphobacter lichenicola]|uniref:Uncharacterized protein n=1 Tax=Tunturiibacter gelidiferens TaxID=3069689 RepID=A0A9X0QJS5_9BACT|nr:hypothetical protein [Edaphobacter lichenicola]